jgi:2-polyprenyl-3-methyl-5-hydroxy-6-metoxy-1,4-benzoquinol methylase
MTETGAPRALAYEPKPEFARFEDPQLAPCQGKRIGILVVTYNAASTLVSVLRRIPPSVWSNVEEVLVFDDASQDATFEVAVGLKAICAVPKLKVQKHEKNLGYGGNQMAGYRYFIERGFDVVILLHGDGQYAPEILASVYHPIVTGEADAVFGSRMMRTYGGPIKGGMPLYKYVGNRILTILENRALGMNLTEFHSGYRAYSLKALAKIDFSQMTRDFHFDTEIIIKLRHQGMRIHEVPIPTYYGSELCYVDGLKYAADVMRAVRRYRKTCRSVFRAPEFAEYFVHYPLKRSKRSSHYYAQRFVGRDKDVLDIGCGVGFFGALLKESGNRVTGVDALPHMAAHQELDEYFAMDLIESGGTLPPELTSRRFDCVLLLDVLEHLTNPERLLSDARDAVREHGRLVVSVPNVANITMRLSLLFGRFNYGERGILDRTHLRFFTRKTALRLLEENGCEVVEMKPTVMPLELVLGWEPTSPAMRAVNVVLAFFTAIFPTLLGYQFVFVARPRA